MAELLWQPPIIPVDGKCPPLKRSLLGRVTWQWEEVTRLWSSEELQKLRFERLQIKFHDGSWFARGTRRRERKLWIPAVSPGELRGFPEPPDPSWPKDPYWLTWLRESDGFIAFQVYLPAGPQAFWLAGIHETWPDIRDQHHKLFRYIRRKKYQILNASPYFSEEEKDYLHRLLREYSFTIQYGIFHRWETDYELAQRQKKGEAEGLPDPTAYWRDPHWETWIEDLEPGTLLPRWIPPLKLADGTLYFTTRAAEVPYEPIYICNTDPLAASLQGEEIGIETQIKFFPDGYKRKAKKKPTWEEECERALRQQAKERHKEELKRLRELREKKKYEHTVDMIGELLAEDYYQAKADYEHYVFMEDVAKAEQARKKYMELEKLLHEREKTVYIPGFKDIFHLRPRYDFTETEKKELEKPSRERDYSVFSKAGIEELNRRRIIARTIRKSPMPQWAQKLTRIVTAIDDVEDFISTVAFMGLMGVALVPATSPVLGPAVVAGEATTTALNITNAVLSLPLGPMGGKRAMEFLLKMGHTKEKAVQRVLTHAYKFKNLAYARIGTSAWARVKEAANIRRWMAAIIEGGQTTDQLFGVGICLGPLMGAISGAIFGTLKGAKGEPVTIKMLPGLKDEVAFLKNTSSEHVYLYGSYDGGIAPMGALKAYAAASELLANPESLTGEQTTRALVGFNLAAQVVDEYVAWSGWMERVEELSRLPAQKRRLTNAATRAALELEGIDPDEEHTAPNTFDVDPEITLDEMIGLSTTLPQAITQKSEEYGWAPESILADSILHSTPHTMKHILGGEWEEPEYTKTPEQLAAELLFYNSLHPPPNTPNEQVWAALAQITDIAVTTGKNPTYSEITQILNATCGGYTSSPPTVPKESSLDLLRATLMPAPPYETTLLRPLTNQEINQLYLTGKTPWFEF